MASAVLAVMMCGGALVLNAADADRPFATIDDDGVIRLSRDSQPSPEVSKIWTTNNVPITSAPVNVEVVKPGHSMPDSVEHTQRSMRIELAIIMVLTTTYIVVWTLLICKRHKIHIPGKHNRVDAQGMPGRLRPGGWRWRSPGPSGPDN